MKALEEKGFLVNTTIAENVDIYDLVPTGKYKASFSKIYNFSYIENTAPRKLKALVLNADNKTVGGSMAYGQRKKDLRTLLEYFPTCEVVRINESTDESEIPPR